MALGSSWRFHVTPDDYDPQSFGAILRGLGPNSRGPRDILGGQGPEQGGAAAPPAPPAAPPLYGT